MYPSTSMSTEKWVWVWVQNKCTRVRVWVQKSEYEYEYKINVLEYEYEYTTTFVVLQCFIEKEINRNTLHIARNDLKYSKGIAYLAD